MEINFNEYRQILEAETVSIHHLMKHFKKDIMDFDEYGNVYVNYSKETKGTPILVAHTDNVLHGERVPVITLDGKRIVGGNGIGIGFDDKAGIIAAIEIWKRMKKQGIRFIFTADEEVGGLGACKVFKEKLEDAAYIIELDRRGGRDLIQESGGTRLGTDEFCKWFEDEGFVKDHGLYTDVNEFKITAPKVNMVNLSIGYYNPHTNNEYLDIEEFETIVNKVFRIISTHKETIVDNEPQPERKKYDYLNYGNYTNYTSKTTDTDDDWWEDTNDMCEYCGGRLGRFEGYVDSETGLLFCDKDCCKHYKEEMGLDEEQKDEYDI